MEDKKTFKILLPLLTFFLLISAEAATGRVLEEKVFVEISLNSQENTCAKVSFLIKLQV